MPDVFEKGVTLTGAPSQETGTKPSESAPKSETESRKVEDSVDDLKKRLEDREKTISRQGTELGDLRKKTDQYEVWLNQIQQQQAALMQRQQQETQRPPDEEEAAWQPKDWENPTRVIDRRVDKKVKAETEQLRRQMMFDVAMTAGANAKEMAMRERPDLFTPEIAGRIDGLVWESVNSGVVNPINVGKAKTWIIAAHLLKGEMSNYGAPSVNPDKPTEGERPSSTKPRVEESGDRMELDDTSRAILQGFGADEGEALKKTREYRKARR